MDFDFDEKYGNTKSKINDTSYDDHKQYNTYGFNEDSHEQHDHDHYFYDTKNGRSGWVGSSWERNE
ncbi:MAG: hypothetical protein MJ246_01625 [Clostridia bacterium]|nr:hypothetical protein [Clostridia bacterium]